MSADKDRHIAKLEASNGRLYADNLALLKRLEEKEQQLVVTEKVLAERERVLKAIPNCPDHGECVPHALEWIASVQQQLAEAQNRIKDLMAYKKWCERDQMHGKESG